MRRFLPILFGLFMVAPAWAGTFSAGSQTEELDTNFTQSFTFDFTAIDEAVQDMTGCRDRLLVSYDPSIGDTSEDAVIQFSDCQVASPTTSQCRQNPELSLGTAYTDRAISLTNGGFVKIRATTAPTGGDTARVTLTCQASKNLSWNGSAWVESYGTGAGSDTNAATICTGTDVYLDGENNCDTLSGGGDEVNVDGSTTASANPNLQDGGQINFTYCLGVDNPADVGCAAAGDIVATDNKVYLASNYGGVQEAVDASCATDKGGTGRLCDGVVVVDGNHSDAATLTLGDGTDPEDLWGLKLVGYGAGQAAGSLPQIANSSITWAGVVNGTVIRMDGCHNCLLQGFLIDADGPTASGIADTCLEIESDDDTVPGGSVTLRNRVVDVVCQDAGASGYLMHGVGDQNDQSETHLFTNVACKDCETAFEVNNQQTQDTFLQNFWADGFTTGLKCTKGHINGSGINLVSNQSDNWFAEVGAGCVSFKVRDSMWESTFGGGAATGGFYHTAAGAPAMGDQGSFVILDGVRVATDAGAGASADPNFSLIDHDYPGVLQVNMKWDEFSSNALTGNVRIDNDTNTNQPVYVDYKLEGFSNGAGAFTLTETNFDRDNSSTVDGDTYLVGSWTATGIPTYNQSTRGLDVAGLTNLSDVIVSAPDTGHVLLHNGAGSFINDPTPQINLTDATNVPAADLEGTIPATVDLAAGVVDAIGELDATIRSGSDVTVVTGTKGGTGLCAEWDVNGDLVEAASAAACGAGGSGDAVTVNSTAIDTTANFLDGDIDFTPVDGGAGGPDDITATVACTGCIDVTDMGANSVDGSELVDGSVDATELDLGIAPTWTGLHAFSNTGTFDFGGPVTATSFAADDLTAEPGNKISLNDNETAFTNDPTCTNSGAAGEFTIIDKDESATDDWVLCDGTTELADLNAVFATSTTVNASTLTGTLPVATVGADHLDALTELDQGIKTAANDTDPLAVYTGGNPGGNVCVEMNSSGQLIAAGGTCASLGPGGTTTIDALGDAAGVGDVALGTNAEYGQTWTWNTPATTVGALDALTLDMELDATTDAQTQGVLVVGRSDGAGTTALESLVRIENNEVTAAVTNGIQMTSAAGTIDVALNVNDAQIDNVLELQSGVLISDAELALLDGLTVLSGSNTGDNTVDVEEDNISEQVDAATIDFGAQFNVTCAASECDVTVDTVAGITGANEDDLSDDLPTVLSGVTTITDTQWCQGNAGSGFGCDVVAADFDSTGSLGANTVALNEIDVSIVPTWTGIHAFEATGTGANGAYDLTVGDTTTPDYGGIQIGQVGLYASSFAASGMDLSGAFLFRQEANLPLGNDPGIEFAWAEQGNTMRMLIPESGAGNATAFIRSGTFAGPYSAVTGNDTVLCDTWTTFNGNIDCDTGTTGADLFVQDDLEVEGLIWSHEGLSFEGATADGLSVNLDVTSDPAGDIAVTLPTAAGKLALTTETCGAGGCTITTGDTIEAANVGLTGVWDAAALDANAVMDNTTETITAAWAFGTGGSIDMNDGTGDSPAISFTAQTGVGWTVFEEDTLDDLTIQANSASPELVSLTNAGAGSTSLTADGNLTGQVLISNQTTGTAPLTVASTTKVGNLNADLLDDIDSAAIVTDTEVPNAAGDIEGDFSTGLVISAGEVEESMLNVTNTPGAPEDNYVLTWNNGGSNFTWAPDAGGSETNTLTAALGGITDDQFVIGGAGVATYDPVPDCDAAGSALTYDTTANNVDCATLWASPTFTGTVTIPSDQVTLDDLVDASATNTVIARDTAAGGTWEEVTAANFLSGVLGENAGTDITADLEEEAHCSEHDSADVDCSGETILLAAGSVNEDELAALITMAVGDEINFDAWAGADGTGLVLPTHTDCASVATEGQACWETDAEKLWIGDGAAPPTEVGAGGGGATTDGGADTYVTSVTDNFVVGGTTCAAGSFCVTEASGNVDSDGIVTADDFDLNAANFKTEMIVIPGASIACQVTNGCVAPVAVGATGVMSIVPTFENGADDTGYFRFVVPDNIQTNDVTVEVRSFVTGGVSGALGCWVIDFAESAESEDDIFNLPTWGTSEGADADYTSVVQYEPEHSATMTFASHGWAAGDTVQGRILRDDDGGHADCTTETLNNNMYLADIVIKYEVDTPFSGE